MQTPAAAETHVFRRGEARISSEIENRRHGLRGWRGRIAVLALFGLSFAGYALAFFWIDSFAKGGF